MPSESQDNFDAVALIDPGKKIVLKTFDTEQEAIDYINGLGDKIAEAMTDDVINAR